MFEFFFKYPSNLFSKGKLVLAAGWPVWLLVLLIVAACVALWWFVFRGNSPLVRGYRRAVIWGLQCALAALLLLMLWQPALSVSALKPRQNFVAVVVDDSRSMAHADNGTIRRDDVVARLAGGLLRKLEEKFLVRLYRMSGKLDRIEKTEELKATGPATRIGDALKQIAAESASIPLGAVVLLSDGADNSGGVDLESIQSIRQRQIPVHTIGVGAEFIEKDVEIADAQVPAKAFAKSRLSTLVTFQQRGFSGARGKITIREAGKVLAAHDFNFKADGAQQTESVLFNAGEPGAKELQVSIEGMPSETNGANNQLTRVLNVSAQKPRILYVEGEPRWEYKFLRRAVQEDDTLELVSLLRTSQNKFYRQGVEGSKELESGFPTTPDELFQYQAIVLGSVEAAWFTPTQQDLLKQFVDRRGGGLIFLAGRASLSDGGYQRDPFIELLPVTLPGSKNTFHRDRANPELTVAGRDSLICRLEENPDRNMERWKKLPYILGYQEVGVPKPGALTLAEMNAEGKARLPLLVTQNYGRGRTAVFAGAGTWRWQMLQPVEDRTHEVFWQQLLRWAVTGTPSRVQAQLARNVLSDDSRVKLRAEIRDKTYLPGSAAKVNARVIAPNGSATDIELRAIPNEAGVFTADFEAVPTGSYGVEVVARQGEEEIGRDLVTLRREDGVAENFRLGQNRELLQKLAEQTSGTFYKLADSDKLASNISFSEAGITVRETKDLWNMPAVFLLAMLLRAAEWILRRKWGVI